MRASSGSAIIWYIRDKPNATARGAITATKFVRDRAAGTTTRVSVSSSGVQGNGISSVPSISADGRYIVFESYADNITPGDDNLVKDVFLRDTELGTTIRVSVSSSEADGNALSGGGRVSGDGRYVAFYSDATNLVPGDTNGATDIFVHDQVNFTDHPGQCPDIYVHSG